MFKTSSCICTKVSLRNSTCNILLQLSKGKRGSVISGVVERECIEFMRERSRGDPRVNYLHRFGARFYKNTFESLHLHLYIILRFCFCQLKKEVKIKNYIMFLPMFMCCCEKPVSWFSNIGFLFGLQQNENYET